MDEIFVERIVKRKIPLMFKDIFIFLAKDSKNTSAKL